MAKFLGSILDLTFSGLWLGFAVSMGVEITPWINIDIGDPFSSTHIKFLGVIVFWYFVLYITTWLVRIDLRNRHGKLF